MPLCILKHSNMKKIIFVLFTLLVSIQVYASKKDTVRVMAVHDGDSYRVKFTDGHQRWVRLAGVDCPEVPSNIVSEDQPFGVLIGDRVRRDLKGKQVILDSLTTDVYGRLVGTIELADSTHMDYAAYLLETGQAWYISSKGLPNKKKTLYAKLHKQAKLEKKVIFSVKDYVKPSTWRKRHTWD